MARSSTGSITITDILDGADGGTGADGADGDAGESAYGVAQTNAAHVFDADALGAVTDFTGSSTTITATYGTSSLSFVNNANPGANQFNVSVVNSAGISGPSGLQTTAVVGNVTAMTTDIGSRVITVETEGPSGTVEQSTDIFQSFSKARSGTIGVDGGRGPGRFDSNGTISVVFPAPVVGSTAFNNDAREIVCESLKGTWTTSCDISLGNPVEGDIIVITYKDSGSSGNVQTRGAIHDGTGVADNDWATFAVQIDGSLLVQGTVVGSAVFAKTQLCVGSGASEGACLDGRSAADQGLTKARRIYAGSQTASENAKIKFSVDEDGGVLIGDHVGVAPRIQITDTSIKIFDTNGLRIQIGEFT